MPKGYESSSLGGVDANWMPNQYARQGRLGNPRPKRPTEGAGDAKVSY
jgi:hypothetical protein